MATLGNKRKLAVLKKETSQEHRRSNLAENSNVLRSQEDYITQVSKKIEGRVTKKLSREFSRTESRILGALLSRFDDFLLNPLMQGHSGTNPETSWNTLGTNRERMRTTPVRSSSWSEHISESEHKIPISVNIWTPFDKTQSSVKTID